MTTVYRVAVRRTATRQVRSQIVVLALLLLPVAAMSQAQSEDLQQEWREIQVEKKRREQGKWWRHLDLDQLNAFIQTGVDVNVADRRGWTPLHSAARFNPDTRIVLALLQAGADVHAKDRSGDTPLHWAAAANANVDIVLSLLEADANVNAVDKFGWLPIHTAAEANPNPEVIRVLLEAGSKRKRRAYFLLFGPRFLLKHNANMSDADKKIAMILLKGGDQRETE